MPIESSVWDRVGAEILPPSGLAARVAIPDVSDRLLAAVDQQGRRHLLVPLGERDLPHSDRKSRGLVAETRDLRLTDGTEGRFIDLLCREPTGHQALNLIGADLAAALAAGIEAPAEAVRRVVARWRHFWLADARRVMTWEEELGLFAELWFFTFWLLPKIGFGPAIDAWRGPLAARHDFEFPNLSVEAKATASTTGRVHQIHGIDQLSPPENGVLYLFSLAVRDEAGGANSLSKLVGRIRDLSSNDDEATPRFEAKLATAGYGSSAELHDIKLRVVDERLYRVDISFPRLVRSSLVSGVPPGVEEIRYRIDLAGFDAHVVTRNPEELNLSALR